MKIEVGDDYRKMRLDLFSRDQVGNNTGRHEMGANHDMRFIFQDKFNQWLGIQMIQHVSHAVGAPRFITGLVPPAKKIGCGLHQFQIKL